MKLIITDINATAQKLKTSGFGAIVIQHEIDYLVRKVFLDRVSNIVKTGVLGNEGAYSLIG